MGQQQHTRPVGMGERSMHTHKGVCVKLLQPYTRRHQQVQPRPDILRRNGSAILPSQRRRTENSGTHVQPQHQHAQGQQQRSGVWKDTD